MEPSLIYLEMGRAATIGSRWGWTGVRAWLADISFAGSAADTNLEEISFQRISRLLTHKPSK